MRTGTKVLITYGILHMLFALTACSLVENSGTIEGTANVNTKPGAAAAKQQEESTGQCGAYSVVGKYEGGLEFTADCQIKYGDQALIFQEYSYVQVKDDTFRTIQSFEIDNTKTLESGWCDAQLFNDELYLKCDGLSYRGGKL